MKEQMPGLLFFLKRSSKAPNLRKLNPPSPKSSSKETDDNTHFIYQRVRVDGKTKEWSIKRKWDARRWNQKLGRASDGKEDAKILNQYLDTLTAQFSRSQNELIGKDTPVTAGAIKEVIKRVTPAPKMLLEEFKDHNEKMNLLVGKEDGYAKGTHDRFETARAHTTAFILYKYKVKDIKLAKLDYDFIESFALWLKTERSCSHNTTMKYLTNMKKVVLKCIKKGFLRDDPFVEYPLTIKIIEKPSLTIAHLNALIEKEFSTFRLSFVRDMFLFSCFTGLSYADVKKLKRRDIVFMEGMNWIVIPRTKTKVEATIPVLPQAQEILNRYSNPKGVTTSEKLIAVSSNQKLNEYLKEIAVLCEIPFNLTFHTARHTFATTITLLHDIPITLVAKMLGHKKLNQTTHYAIVQQRQIAKQMKALPEKLKLSFNGQYDEA